MTTKRPRLYPRHQHEWVDAEIADPMKQNRQIVRCTVCEFTVPRNLANLDGKPADPPPDAHEWGLDDWRAWDAGRANIEQPKETDA